MATSHIMVFGGGTVTRADGNIQLHARSLERAERVIEYYHEHKDLFSNTSTQRPFILCTGGFGLLSAGVKTLENHERESVLMATHLVARGGIPEEIILLEKDSTSTLTNWTNSLRLYKDLIDPRNFSKYAKLGLVSHPYHLERVVFLAEKLGYKKEHLELIPTTQLDNEEYEASLLAAYKDYLKEAFSPSEMIAQENALAQNRELLTHLRSLQ